MVNQSVNEFYNRFLFKIESLPKDVVFLIDIASIFFNKLSPNVRELLISEGVLVIPRNPAEINHQRNGYKTHLLTD